MVTLMDHGRRHPLTDEDCDLRALLVRLEAVERQTALLDFLARTLTAMTAISDAFTALLDSVAANEESAANVISQQLATIAALTAENDALKATPAGTSDAELQGLMDKVAPANSALDAALVAAAPAPPAPAPEEPPVDAPVELPPVEG